MRRAPGDRAIRLSQYTPRNRASTYCCPQADRRRPLQPRDRATLVLQQRHRQDPHQPHLRQDRRPRPRPSRPLRLPTWTRINGGPRHGRSLQRTVATRARVPVGIFLGEPHTRFQAHPAHSATEREVVGGSGVDGFPKHSYDLAQPTVRPVNVRSTEAGRRCPLAARSSRAWPAADRVRLHRASPIRSASRSGFKGSA